MYRRFHAQLASLTLVVFASGCVQMTRHSNAIVFGTNTSVGLRVGTSATSVPELQVGYSRQEAVLMPVIANTTQTNGVGDNPSLLQPCPMTTEPAATGTTALVVHPCSLVAINGSSLDSYSVLASFGANFDASGTTTDVGAKGGLAQYFATGMAAQLLALNGGAAVVAVGEAAKASSGNPASKETTKALFNNPTAFAIGAKNAETYPAFKDRLIAVVNAAPTDVDVAAKIKLLEAGLPVATPMQAKCAAKSPCIAGILKNGYGQAYNINKNEFEIALDKLENGK